MLGVWSQVETTFPGMFAEDPYAEWGIHFDEEPQMAVFEDAVFGGRIEVDYFPSDGCLLVRVPGRQPQWVPRSNIGNDDEAPQARLSWLLAGLSGLERPCLVEGCWNPHPGEFETWLGDWEQEWVPVYRQWPDGCRHYQMRRRDGLWHTDAKGFPIVCWTRCVHPS
jgi:hypothetical protein